MRDLVRQRLGILLGIVAVVVVLSATRLAAFATDLWWFDELGLRAVFTRVLLTKVGLGLVFGGGLAALVAGNLAVARRLRPIVVPASPREAVIERYRQLAEPYIPYVIVGIAAVFAVSSGLAAASEWDRFLLWLHGGGFGVDDPQFRRDVGFYVFDLPWLQYLQGWVFTSLVLTLLITAGAHYLLGSIRPELPRDRVTPQAKAHLSVLLAFVLAARGWGYWLGRFRLNFSPLGQVTGASYTDVHAKLPALNLLLVVTAVAIVLVLWNISRRGWLLPGAAIGLLVLASVILQGLYPAAVQRLRVEPQELARETPFIARNLEATRTAYGLGDVALTRFPVDNALDAADVEENALTLKNVRLWDAEVLKTTYKQLQAIRTYYEFDDVDVDRYQVDGEARQVMLAARELSTPELDPEAQTWQNLHLTYTHGYGVVSSQVNTASKEGQPVFLVRNIPPEGDAAITPKVAGIYYGERHADYSVVRTDQPEFDYETSEGQVTTTYDGPGGVPVDGPLRRLAFATRFTDPNLVLSGLIRDDSRIMFRRQVPDRVRTVAPFLTLDADPYPVVLDGRVLWVQDAYTTSAHYPYSQRRQFKDGETVNYVRNSVKAVVDAYDGSVRLYVVDPTDPVVRAWERTFPEMFSSLEEVPEGLEAHFRYPQDMFELQSKVYSTYHIPTPEAFYSKADAWQIPLDAAAIQNLPDASTQRPELKPYYLLMRLPGEEKEEFVLIQPYLALNKPNMIAWLAGRSDPGVYGQLSAVQFPSGQTILGPSQAQAKIEQDGTVAAYITLRDAAGSEVQRGNLLVLPIEQSVLYVEPLFLKSPQAEIPELDKVVLVLGENVVMADTLSEGLTRLLGAAPEVPGEPEPGGEGGEAAPDEESVEALLAQAFEAFAAAEAALRDGDLAAYQRNVDAARRLLERAGEQLGVAPPGQQASSDAEAPAPQGGAGSTGT